jgi:hypothetical protein
MIKEMLDLEWTQRRFDEVTSPRKRYLALSTFVFILVSAGVYWYYTEQKEIPAFMVMFACLFLSLFQKTKRIAELELELAKERNRNATKQSA